MHVDRVYEYPHRRTQPPPPDRSGVVIFAQSVPGSHKLLGRAHSGWKCAFLLLYTPNFFLAPILDFCTRARNSVELKTIKNRTKWDFIFVAKTKEKFFFCGVYGTIVKRGASVKDSRSTEKT